jgi:dTDP-4-amino-4,6-dideoxygalactose transaminase
MKSRIEDLALFGGDALFNQDIHVGRPNLGRRDRLFARINEILDSRSLTNNGRYVKEFETRVAALVGVRECVAVCNGTLGLQILAKALELEGEVIVPSFTFVATPNSLDWIGIKPVFCDVDPHTHCLDPSCVEALITPRTTGIVGVHLWGRACNIAALEDVARRRNLKVIFDASHAFGCSYRAQMIGASGHAEVFSFHATKFVNAFEGGAVTTNDVGLASKLRLLRNYGFDGFDETGTCGTNAKLNEVAAAMGLTSLESMPDIVTANYANYNHYAQQLDGVHGISLLKYDEDEKCNFQYVVVLVNAETATITRDMLQTVLQAERVLARRYFYPGCHRLEPYIRSEEGVRPKLRHTERLASEVLCLPTGTAVGPVEVEAISGLIRFAILHGTNISRRAGCDTNIQGVAKERPQCFSMAER